MTSPTIMRPPRARRDLKWLVWVVPVLIAGVIVIAVGARLFRGPEFVDRLTIVNDTEFDVNVDVAGSDGRALGLQYAAAGETVVVQDVIDQGEVWEFQFSYGGTDGGTLRRDRATLENNDWRVEVPATVAEQLAAAGHEPQS